MSSSSPGAARVLIVDDDPAIHHVLGAAFTAVGYDAAEALNGGVGLAQIERGPPDAVILDLGLPDMDGHQFLARAGAIYRGPIIVLSARTREAEKIMALDNGAVDYIQKPFDVGELLARLRAALRRPPLAMGRPQLAQAEGLTVDLGRRLVIRDGAIVRLASKEFELLAFLAKADGRPVSAAALLTGVWGAHRAQDIHYLRVFISQVRRKIENNPGQPTRLITEKNFGYRLIQHRDEAR